ncbi:hypothetical protein D3C87_1229860 [compost metagenome]
MHRQAEARDARAVQLFGQHAGVAEVAAAAAVFGRHSDAQQPFAAGLEPGLAVGAAGGVPGGLARQAFALEKSPCGVAQHLVVFAVHGAVDVHGGSPCLAAILGAGPP